MEKKIGPTNNFTPIRRPAAGLLKGERTFAGTFDHKMKMGEIILNVAKALGSLLALLGGFIVFDGLVVPKSILVSIWPEVLLGIVLLAIGSVLFLFERILLKKRPIEEESVPKTNDD